MIPQNMEKNHSLTVGQLKFIDSFQFTPKGLDVLARTLADDEFRYLRESCTSSFWSHPMKRCPYNYMDSFDKFEETKLPFKDAFFSKLSGNPCSESEYTHATRVCTAFGCRTIADYHDIYLQLDVLDVFFETFRSCPSGTLLHHSWSCLGCGSQNVTC